MPPSCPPIPWRQDLGHRTMACLALVAPGDMPASAPLHWGHREYRHGVVVLGAQQQGEALPC